MAAGAAGQRAAGGGRARRPGGVPVEGAGRDGGGQANQGLSPLVRALHLTRMPPSPPPIFFLPIPSPPRPYLQPSQNESVSSHSCPELTRFSGLKPAVVRGSAAGDVSGGEALRHRAAGSEPVQHVRHAACRLCAAVGRWPAHRRARAPARRAALTNHALHACVMRALLRAVWAWCGVGGRVGGCAVGVGQGRALPGCWSAHTCVHPRMVPACSAVAGPSRPCRCRFACPCSRQPLVSATATPLLPTANGSPGKRCPGSRPAVSRTACSTGSPRAAPSAPSVGETDGAGCRWSLFETAGGREGLTLLLRVRILRQMMYSERVPAASERAWAVYSSMAGPSSHSPHLERQHLVPGSRTLPLAPNGGAAGQYGSRPTR